MQRAPVVAILFLCAITYGWSQPRVSQITASRTDVCVTLEVPSTLPPSVTCSMEYGPPNHHLLRGYPPSRVRMPDAIEAFSGCVVDLDRTFPLDADIRLLLRLWQGSELLQTVDTIVRRQPVPTNDLPSTSRTLYVAPSGSGNDYTEARPGSLGTLLSQPLPCGITIVCTEGTYYINDLVMRFDTACVEPVVVTAKGTVVLSGAPPVLTSAWHRWALDTTIWTATVDPSAAFSSHLVLNNTRLYPYALVQQSPAMPSYPSLATLGYDCDGYARDGTTFYIKTADDVNPNTAEVRISSSATCLTVEGGGRPINLIINGLQFADYGKGQLFLNAFGLQDAAYPSTTLRVVDASNVRITNCVFRHTNFPILFEGRCSNLTVRGCSIYDNTGEWSHGAFKQTRDVIPFVRSSYGRYLENAGIWVNPGEQAVVTDVSIDSCTVVGTASGIILGGYNANYVVRDSEVRRCTVERCYDGIDAIGGNGAGHSNVRIAWNMIGRGEPLDPPVGTSLMLPSIGPIYVYRNVYHVADRVNHNNDVVFVDCTGERTDRSWSTVLKLNAGSNNTTPGDVVFVHNTVLARGAAGYGMYVWNSTWKSLHVRNSIVVANEASPLMFDGMQEDTSWSIAMTGNVLWSDGSDAVARLRLAAANGRCTEVHSVNALQNQLRNAVASTRIDVDSSTRFARPEFQPPPSHHLLADTCALVDAAPVVDGFSMPFSGGGPEPGAFELPARTSVRDSNVHQSPLSLEWFDVLGRRFLDQPKHGAPYVLVRPRTR